jgi:hypothetical protein
MERKDEVVRENKHYVRDFESTNRGEETYWYRISSRFLRRDGKKVRWVPLHKRDLKHEWEFIHLRDDGKKLPGGEFGKEITDKKLIRKLQSQFDREEEQRLDALSNAVRAIEEARNPTPAEREDKPAKKAPAPSSSGDEIKRDKHGIKLWSYGGNYSLSVCVNNATKYPGNYSVCLLVAGRRLTYTLGKKEMRALAREVARAFSAKELRELL